MNVTISRCFVFCVNTCADELSEDICQNVFIKFWDQRGEPVIIRELSAWLFTMAKRMALDFLRRAAVEEAAMGTILAA